jgi:hypothetical protein
MIIEISNFDFKSFLLSAMFLVFVESVRKSTFPSVLRFWMAQAAVTVRDEIGHLLWMYHLQRDHRIPTFSLPPDGSLPHSF